LFTHSNPQDIFDTAIERMQLRDARASIIMCHARNATANPFAPGNHPFIFNLNNVTYTLMHNGFISLEARRFMINEIAGLDSEWFSDNQPNLTGFVNSNNPEYWIDSEVLFHYLLCHIKQNDNDVYKGLKLSLKKIEHFMKLSTNVVNFVLSNGHQLYVFRSSSLTAINSNYKLSYKDSGTGFYGVRSGVPTSNETQVSQFELVIFSQDAKIQRYPSFLYDEALSAYRPGHNSVIGSRSSHPALGNNESGVRIAFSLTTASRIKLSIYNMKGQLVKQLADKVYLAGSHTVYWKGQNNNGNSVVPGVYFIETINGNSRSLNKVIYYR
jgi:predicted glutamine amidotransferase